MKGKIFYSEQYNYLVPGWRLLRHVHKFPPDRYKQVANYLIKEYGFNDFIGPTLKRDLILDFLKVSYKNKILNDIDFVWEILELPKWMKRLPSIFKIIQDYVITPMLLGSCGTVEAALSALEHGRAVNISGGYHHASFESGEGFCFFPDAMIAVRRLQQEEIQRIAIIDLDAHQGNGTAKAKGDDENVLLMDMCMFNPQFKEKETWPSDQEAAVFVDLITKISSPNRECNNSYFKYLEKHLEEVLNWSPGFIIYNAGTDVYKEDTVGAFINLSEEEVLRRDRMVFEVAEKLSVPILMLLSGGYHKGCVRIVGKSIHEHFIG